ncbi:50S ribosome-binding GTPase [Streptomyces flavotricini]|uniref:50S ribosome-binding GTPase n=1 Tax=Streptomyces flavotricini TaxID=66888 RepID=A0ABS8EAT3_9ACTN|nr:GTPase [Streptomyces flavotricini]MCC0098078.1 50S ribosome-binding GTPase [Streptomyces flavotricini]
MAGTEEREVELRQAELAEGVALLADRAGADSTASLIRRTARRAESPQARICVIGGSNVGKSRLVNELVGAVCVPVSVHPTDGPPVVVRPYAAESEQSGELGGPAGPGGSAGPGGPAAPGGSPGPAGSGHEAGSDAAPGPGDPGPAGLRTVRVEVPSGSWPARTGVELVDTPGWEGWSGVRKPDTAALARIVGDCDVVVVVTEARRAMLATEQARIKALATAPHSPPLAVVVTKLAEVEDEAADIMRRVNHLVSVLAPEALVLPGPVPATGPVPASGAAPGAAEPDGVDPLRAVLGHLAGIRLRRALRTIRRLHLLAATCALVEEAAGRALTDVNRPDPVRTRAAQIWHTAQESARFHWIVLSADAGEWRATLVQTIAAEARKRRAAAARELAARFSRMLDTPQEQHFIRLHAIPYTAEALQRFEAWITEAVDRALEDDTRRLRAALLRNRPGEELFQGLAAPDAGRVVPSAALPGVAEEAAAAESRNATGWDASWLPEFVGTAIESVLTPMSAEAVGQIAGAAGTALVAEALEHGQAERRERAIDDLERIVEAAFTEQVARTEARIGQVYDHLLSRARDRDEQWWRLHTTAVAAQPESLDHWRSLQSTARTLGRSVHAHLLPLEGA